MYMYSCRWAKLSMHDHINKCALNDNLERSDSIYGAERLNLMERQRLKKGGSREGPGGGGRPPFSRGPGATPPGLRGGSA